MSKVEELSRQYAEQQVKDSPDNEYKGYSFELQKELTRFDGYDIEEAYQTGYEQAEKDLTLTLEDIKMIYRLVGVVADDLGIKAINTNIYQEVLNRFNKQKESSYEQKRIKTKRE